MDEKLRRKLAAAVRHFWRTRTRQQSSQGAQSGQRDYGARGAVTGAKQLDGFVELVQELLLEAGLTDGEIHRREVTLPGYFRPTKAWDLLVIADGNLLATLEFKSQVGPSFGNNFNNRTEEAMGSATDLWTAFREGAFKDSTRPWLGYFMLLENAPGSTNPVSVREPHFKVFPEFKNSSYAKRYELFCLRLVRERLYDGACLLVSERSKGRRGEFSEPSSELCFNRLAAGLMGHVSAYVKMRRHG